jgi:hypothetical protein
MDWPRRLQDGGEVAISTASQKESGWKTSFQVLGWQ